MKIIALLLAALGCAIALDALFLDHPPKLLLSLALISAGMWLGDLAERRRNQSR